MKKTVLVVEDKQVFRATLAEILKSNGYDTLEAKDGFIAREILSNRAVDVILADIRMPGSDGIELFHWINKNRPTPFIFITGCSHILNAQAAYDLGAAGFVAKPFAANEILLEIRAVLEKEERTRSVFLSQFKAA